MGPFNNREIATAFWLLILSGWALQNAHNRELLAGVVRDFCHVKIIASVCLVLLYTAAAVALLAAIGLWKTALLKDTIVWFCFSAVAMMIRFHTPDNTENIFKKVLGDSIKVVIVLEFLVNTYTFSLLAEFMIVPVFAVIVMADAVASTEKKYFPVAKLTKGLWTAIVFVILVIALSRAISDPQNLYTLDTVRSIALAPLLALFLSPFLYVMVKIKNRTKALTGPRPVRLGAGPRGAPREQV